MSPRSQATLLAVLSLAAGLLAGGCGSDQVSPEAVAEAAEATIDAGGSRIALNGDLEVEGQRLTITGSGVQDAKGRRGSLDMRLGNFPRGQVPEGTDAGDFRFRQVFDGSVMYMSSPLFEAELPEGKDWIKIDLAKTYRDLGVNFEQLASAGSSNPADSLDYLRAMGDIERVGTEDVRGVETTHYRGTTDLREVLEELPARERARAKAGIERLLETSGASSKTPMEVWVDSKKLVRRERVSFSFEPKSGEKVKSTMTIEFFDFGTPVAIRIPRDNEVEDVTELAASELRKGAK